MKCSCDACDTVFGEHDARSPDGYCAFCSTTCFPLAEFHGRSVRTALGKTSRQSLHDMKKAGSKPDEWKKMAEAARQEAADAAVSLLGPLMQRAGKVAIEKLREKIRGK